MKNRKKMKKISLLIQKKSTKHLRVSTIVFFMALLTLTMSYVFVRNEYKQIDKNFLKNNYTHIIEVSGKTFENGDYEYPSLELKNQVAEMVKATEPDASIFCVYNFGFGFATDNELFQDINIFGIDEEGEQFLLKNIEMQDDTIYATNSMPSALCLYVPNVIADDDILKMEEETPVEMMAQLVDRENVFQVYGGIELQTYFVNYATYNKIYRICVGEDATEESFLAHARLQPIYKVFVYVNDISRVEKIAKKLNKQGYMVNYVFQSFEDIGESMSYSLKLLILFSICLFFFSAISLLLSWKSFIKLQSKDMGILKQMGYDKKEIVSVFSYNVKMVLFILMLCVNIVTLIAGVLVLGLGDWLYLCAVMGGVIIFIFVLEKIIIHIYLEKQARLNVLDLLRRNKQFE